MTSKSSSPTSKDDGDTLAITDVDDERYVDQFPDEKEAEFKDTWWKRVARFLFSFVGLLLLLAAYSVGGKTLV